MCALFVFRSAYDNYILRKVQNVLTSLIEQNRKNKRKKKKKISAMIKTNIDGISGMVWYGIRLRLDYLSDK